KLAGEQSQTRMTWSGPAEARLLPAALNANSVGPLVTGEPPGGGGTRAARKAQMTSSALDLGSSLRSWRASAVPTARNLPSELAVRQRTGPGSGRGRGAGVPLSVFQATSPF